jgi:primosomal protein N'
MSMLLNIVTAPPPPKKQRPPPKPPPAAQNDEPVPTEEHRADPAPLPPQQPPAKAPAKAPASATGRTPANIGTSAAAPRKRKTPTTGADTATSADAAAVVSAAAPAPAAAPASDQAAATKRSRYASASAVAAVADSSLRKEDPTRAAALPSTLPLEGAARNADAFSATTFDQLPLDSYLLRHVRDRMGLSQLTPVQQHAIPTLLRGADLLVRSPTGSGKTLAYALPIVATLVARGKAVVTRAAGTFALILVPTRELCVQTHEVVQALATPYPWIVTSHLMGGEKRKAEKAPERGSNLTIPGPSRDRS